MNDLQMFLGAELYTAILWTFRFLAFGAALWVVTNVLKLFGTNAREIAKAVFSFSRSAVRHEATERVEDTSETSNQQPGLSLGKLQDFFARLKMPNVDLSKVNLGWLSGIRKYKWTFRLLIVGLPIVWLVTNLSDVIPFNGLAAIWLTALTSVFQRHQGNGSTRDSILWGLAIFFLTNYSPIFGLIVFGIMLAWPQIWLAITVPSEDAQASDESAHPVQISIEE